MFKKDAFINVVKYQNQNENVIFALFLANTEIFYSFNLCSQYEIFLNNVKPKNKHVWSCNIYLLLCYFKSCIQKQWQFYYLNNPL